MYLVFDLETETHASYKRKASPFDERNWVVQRGWKHQGESVCSSRYYAAHNRKSYLRIHDGVTLLVGFNIKFDLLWEMAQGNPDLKAFFARGGKVWDGQYAEYLLEAQKQSAQMCAMNDLAPKYGGTEKVDEVKAMWEAGVLTSDIPEDLLTDYLIGTEEEGRNGGDIRNTELIFLGQIKRAHEMGMLKMIQDRMDGLLATTDMEFRGLKIDVAEAGRRLKVLNADLATVSATLNEYVPKDLEFEFNWGSPIHSSCLVYGGTVRYQKQATYIDEATGELARLKAKAPWPLFDGEAVDPDGTDPVIGTDGGGLWYNIKTEQRQDTYKSGKRKGEAKFKQMDVPGELKVKYQDFFREFPGHTVPEVGWKTQRDDGAGNPVYSITGDIIEELGVRNIPFLKALARKQSLDKEIGTYYAKRDPKTGEWKGMLTCVQLHDHILHHKLNHVNTVTTRLSSSDPNLQNLPRADKSEVKRQFVSRFTRAYCKAHGLPEPHIDSDNAGVMIEADYSQLEVVVQGVLSGDVNLCNDLRAKIDFHCKRVSAKFGISYDDALVFCKDEDHPEYGLWKPRRTGVKEFSFQRAYGAGAAAIAYATGMDIEDVKELIEKEDEMYPGVGVFNAEVEAACIKSARPFQAANDNGVWQTYRRGYWQSFTGTLYSWRTYDAPAFLQKRGIRDSFNPPEMKNYPVQGTGGEFVQAILGLLWRHFVSTDFYGGRAFLVNTVHDCVWIDCHKSVLDLVAADVKRIMESIPEFYNTRHGANIDVPFPVEVECGANMYDLKHWKPLQAAA